MTKRKVKQKEPLLKLRISTKLSRAIRDEAKRRGITKPLLVRQVLSNALLQLSFPFEDEAVSPDRPEAAEAPARQQSLDAEAPGASSSLETALQLAGHPPPT